jgi:hypothetical protein
MGRGSNRCSSILYRLSSITYPLFQWENVALVSDRLGRFLRWPHRDPPTILVKIGSIVVRQYWELRWHTATTVIIDRSVEDERWHYDR